MSLLDTTGGVQVGSLRHAGPPRRVGDQWVVVRLTTVALYEGTPNVTTVGLPVVQTFLPYAGPPGVV